VFNVPAHFETPGLPLCTDDHILEWSSALDTSVVDNWKINNPTVDVVNDVIQDFSLKYSNNKMGIKWLYT
jgi:hypothetical protein